MKRYLRIYKQIFKINFALLAADKFGFFSNVVSTLCWTMLAIVTMIVLAGRARSIFGWTQGELLLLTAAFTILVGLFAVIFKKSFNRFSEMILYGNLDGILLKPIDSQFLVSCFYIGISNILRSVVGFIFLFYVIQRFHYTVTLLSSISFFIFLLLGLIMFYSVWMAAATVLIWFPRLSNLLEVVNSLNQVTKYPPEMYREFNTFLFLFLLPYTLIVVTPVKVLLQKASVWDLLGLFVCAIVFFSISRMFWLYALRHYTSASS